MKQPPDAGAQTLLIPMVKSAQQTQALVGAVTYLRHGARSVGSAVAHASDFEAIPDNLQTARDEVCLLVLVENCKGLEALDSNLEVDSIVGVFIGLTDLAAGMESIGQADAAEVKNALVVASQISLPGARLVAF